MKISKRTNPKQTVCVPVGIDRAVYFDKARLVAREMTDLLVLDLVDKRLLTSQIVMTVGYDIENLTNAEIRKTYKGQLPLTAMAEPFQSPQEAQ